jgi:hypothetical protein
VAWSRTGRPDSPVRMVAICGRRAPLFIRAIFNGQVLPARRWRLTWRLIEVIDAIGKSRPIWNRRCSS